MIRKDSEEEADQPFQPLAKTWLSSISAIGEAFHYVMSGCLAIEVLLGHSLQVWQFLQPHL